MPIDGITWLLKVILEPSNDIVNGYKNGRRGLLQRLDTLEVPCHHEQVTGLIIVNLGK